MDRLAALLEYLEEDPGDPFTRFAVALEYLKAGDESEARRTFEGLVEGRPDYVGAYYHLGGLYARQGLMEAAIATYRAGIEVANQQRDVHARSELQSALLEAEGIGFEDE